MNSDDPRALLDEVKRLRERVALEGAAMLRRWQPALGRGSFQASAENLAHYVALRHLDLRPLQAALAPWGLASLARCESRVMPTLDVIIANLAAISGGGDVDVGRPAASAFASGIEAIEHNATTLFGQAPEGRETRILVTLSSRAADDRDRVRGLFEAGMDCARINCGRDSQNVWAAMIDNVRAVRAETGRSCPVLMDLSGPKIRTRTVIAPKGKNAVKAGDRILLVFDEPRENKRFPFQTSCSMPEVLRQVKVGAKVSIRDGLIAGVVEKIRRKGLVMMVTRTPPDGQPLQPKRGINFPGTALHVPPLTETDLKDLDFVAANADGVSYSFVQRAEDIAWLQRELEQRRPGRPPMPIIAKIETQLAIANLPDMIVQAAGSNPFGVMIARGDLAVEIGYERLSEVQEEILWLCEAAHVPVIWATQVLESLIKRGMPSRGEFTDAAMADRAECVMLNKGEYVGEGITVLDNVIRRLETHKRKRSLQLRPLRAWEAVH
jgi:pyruvate kinase